jgi:phosphoribosylglycinamide formyltransferase-1
MIRIAIFASGAGSNAAKIIDFFHLHETIAVTMIVSNKKDAGVIRIAEAKAIPVLIIEKDRFFNGDGYLPELRASRINFLVLAGFLWKVPASIIQAYPGAIINIHPALLPRFGGKGMYGMNVHKEVLEKGEIESGITIHFVDEQYDNGDVIYQEKCTVYPTDTPATLAARIHELEHQHFPRVIEQVAVLHNKKWE